MEKTSKKVARKAAKIINDKNASAEARAVAASALTQSQGGTQQERYCRGWIAVRAITKNGETAWKAIPDSFSDCSITSMDLAAQLYKGKPPQIIKTIRAVLMLEYKP